MATCVHVRQSNVGTAECLNAFDHLGFLFTNHVDDLSSYLGTLLQHNILNNNLEVSSVCVHSCQDPRAAVVKK